MRPRVSQGSGRRCPTAHRWCARCCVSSTRPAPLKESHFKEATVIHSPVCFSSPPLCAGDTPCPLSVEMVDEFENFLKTWKREIHDNTDGTELVLDTLQPGTLLEACSFLGDMRSAGHELERLEKRNDMWLKVPLMATCRMIQRVVDTLRAEGEQWRTRCLEAEAALKKGAAAGEEVEMAAEA